MFFSRLGWCVLVLSLAGCGSMVVNPVTGQSERSVMDEPTEIAAGAKAHQQVLQEYEVLNSPTVQSYVQGLGQRLAAQSHRSQLQWHFTVLDSPEINAFALPGGYVYVTRGIMAYMESEADLAGVIGHEIGHVTARHGAQRATQEQTAGLGVLAANVLGLLLESQGLPGAGQVAGQVSQSVASGLVASYGRDQELQADGLGAEYLSRVHFDPRNMVDVITVLKNQERFAADLAREEGRAAPKQSSWLASHPSNDQRLETIAQLAAQYKGQAGYQDEGRQRYLKAVAGLPFGDSAAQGLVRGRHFFHTGLNIAITAPEGWKIQNSAQSLALVHPQGDAGLLVRLAPAKAGRSHEEVIKALFAPTQGSAQVRSLHGLQATQFTGQRQNAQGQTQALDVTVVTGPQDRIYVLQPAGQNAQAIQRVRTALQEAQESFRALTEQDRKLARPWVIKTVPFPAGGFAELAANSPLARAEQQLRLINGYYGGGAPVTGAWVKVVSEQ